MIDVAGGADDRHALLAARGYAIVVQNLTGRAKSGLGPAFHETLIRHRRVLAGEVYAPLRRRFVARDGGILSDEPARVARENVRICLCVAEGSFPIPRSG